MKVVINRCYGGFGLSKEAMLRYCELKGIVVYPERQSYGSYIYWKDVEKKKAFWDGDINRNDPVLIQVVEELGAKANGEYAELKIISIPDDISWEIDEYDGMERVEEVHRSWG